MYQRKVLSLYRNYYVSMQTLLKYVNLIDFYTSALLTFKYVIKICSKLLHVMSNTQSFYATCKLSEFLINNSWLSALTSIHSFHNFNIYCWWLLSDFHCIHLANKKSENNIDYINKHYFNGLIYYIDSSYYAFGLPSSINL